MRDDDDKLKYGPACKSVWIVVLKYIVVNQLASVCARSRGLLAAIVVVFVVFIKLALRLTI